MGGRRTSTRTEKVVTVVNYEEALAFPAVHFHADVVNAVNKVVKALVKAGQTVPGVEVREEIKVI